MSIRSQPEGAAGDLSLTEHPLIAATGQHRDGATLDLIVTPRAGMTALGEMEGAAVRVRVAAPPVDGAANAALVRFLADLTGLPKSAVGIVSGGHGRRKRVLFAGLTRDELLGRLTGAMGC